MLSWEWPWLGLLLPVPWLVRHFLPVRTQQPDAVRVPFYRSITAASQAAGVKTQPMVIASLTTLVWLMLILSAARPVWFGDPVTVTTSGRDLMLAIDISDSMRIDDMLVEEQYVTRISAIKKVAGEFIERRQSDRIGLILFGQRSYLQTPLTFDRNSVMTQLNEALPGFAGSSTAIGDAIGLAITTLRDRQATSRVLVLLTDGANTSGSEPADAIDIAVEADIRIHTIGVGADTQRIVDITGRERDIDPSRDLDESTLVQIAEKTGGQYFRAHDPAEMAAVYSVIDELEPAPEEKAIRPLRSLFHWPLVPALVLTVMLLLICARQSGRTP